MFIIYCCICVLACVLCSERVECAANVPAAHGEHEAPGCSSCSGHCTHCRRCDPRPAGRSHTRQRCSLCRRVPCSLDSSVLSPSRCIFLISGVNAAVYAPKHPCTVEDVIHGTYSTTRACACEWRAPSLESVGKTDVRLCKQRGWADATKIKSKRTVQKRVGGCDVQGARRAGVTPRPTPPSPPPLRALRPLPLSPS